MSLFTRLPVIIFFLATALLIVLFEVAGFVFFLTAATGVFFMAAFLGEAVFRAVVLPFSFLAGMVPFAEMGWIAFPVFSFEWPLFTTDTIFVAVLFRAPLFFKVAEAFVSAEADLAVVIFSEAKTKQFYSC